MGGFKVTLGGMGGIKVTLGRYGRSQSHIKKVWEVSRSH